MKSEIRQNPFEISLQLEPVEDSTKVEDKVDEEQEEMGSPTEMQEVEKEIGGMDAEGVLEEILAATSRKSDEYGAWQGIAKVIKDNPPFSNEENLQKTRILQAQKAECERILEETIAPLLGGSDQAFKTIKAAGAEQERIPVAEVKINAKEKNKPLRPLGEALYRFANRDNVIKALRTMAENFSSDAVQTQEFREAVSQLERIDAQRKESISEIVNHNLGLVASFAKKYAPYASTPRAVLLPLSDVFQEGIIGCMKGVDMYDPERGRKLSTYLGYCIKQVISRESFRKGAAIRLPEGRIGVFADAEKAYRTLLQELEREPTAAEIAERAGVTVQEIEAIQSVSAVRSLDAPAGESGDARPLQIADPSAAPEALVIKNVSREEVRAVVNTLPEHLRNVILAVHFSDPSGRTLSFREVGDRAREFGIVSQKSRKRGGEGAVSHQSVQQRYLKAINELRKKLRST